jgi:hypothetical protein
MLRDWPTRTRRGWVAVDAPRSRDALDFTFTGLGEIKGVWRARIGCTTGRLGESTAHPVLITVATRTESRRHPSPAESPDRHVPTNCAAAEECF